MKKEIQDLAWRSLPEEVKKEIVGEYNSAYHIYINSKEHVNQIYYTANINLLENLFGVDKFNQEFEKKSVAPKFKVGDVVHCTNPEKEGVYRVIRSYSDVNLNYYDCREAFTGKLLLYMFCESDLEQYTWPDTSHKQPDDENHPNDTSHGNRNLSQDTANCDISRLQIAAMAMQGLLNATFGKFDPKIQPDAIARVAVEYTDALIRANEMADKPAE